MLSSVTVGESSEPITVEDLSALLLPKYLIFLICFHLPWQVKGLKTIKDVFLFLYFFSVDMWIRRLRKENWVWEGGKGAGGLILIEISLSTSPGSGSTSWTI